MNRRDILFSITTGLTTGLIFWRVFNYLDIHPFGLDSFSFLVVLIPVLWVIGVWFGYFLSNWFRFFRQFGKFVAIGFTNSAIDFGVFNFLFSLSKENQSLFPVFSVISFILAVNHSYFMNKWWAFDAGNTPTTFKQIRNFVAINLVALVVNVGIAFAVFHGVPALFGLNIKSWANISKVAGSAVALIFSFIGFRLVVFNKFR